MKSSQIAKSNFCVHNPICMAIPSQNLDEHLFKSIQTYIVFLQAKDNKLWALEARRNLVLTLLDCWVEKCEEDATVEVIDH